MSHLFPLRRSVSRFSRRATLCLAAFGLAPDDLSAQEIDPLSVVYIECVLDGRTAFGSGVVIDTDGRVLTALHVVRDKGAQCTGALGTQSDPSELKDLRVVSLAPTGHDVAMLMFVSNPNLEFLPVPYAGTAGIDQGVDVVGFGYHPRNQGEPDTASGKIKSTDRLVGGTIKTDMNTVRGMSGGPVVSAGKLLGIITGEQFDDDGQMVATQFVVADEFPSDIQQWLVQEAPSETSAREAILNQELAADDLCTQIMREQISVRGDQFPKAAEIVSPHMQVQASQLADIAEHWVTVTTGPAEWIDCSSGNMLKTLYFPMGMMVRPEREVTINGAVWTVFLTEHGLRVFLDERAVAPVTEESAYVFAVANGAFEVCKRDDKGCDVYREYPLTDHDEHWPFLSGYQSYLRSADAAGIDIARLQLEELYDYQVDPPPPHDPFRIVLDLSKPSEIDACKPRSAMLYSFFGRYDPDDPQKGSEYRYPVEFSLCTVNGGQAYNRFERIKLVTDSYARTRFEQLWAVNTMRKPPGNIEAATKALFQVESTIVGTFRCGEPREGLFTYGTAASNKINVLSDVIDSDKNRYSVFRQFQIAQAQSPVDIFKSAPLFNDIELSMACDEEDEIRNAGSLIIDLTPLSDGAKLELRLIDLFDALREQFENLGMVDEKTLKKRLREGVMYRICEFHEYIAWRTILFNEVKDSDLVRQAKDILNVELNLMADHISHLIMASVFSTDVKLRVSRNTRQGCE